MFQRASDYNPLPTNREGGLDGRLQNDGSLRYDTYKRSELYVFVVSLLINAIALTWVARDQFSEANFLPWKGLRPQYSECLIMIVTNYILVSIIHS